MKKIDFIETTINEIIRLYTEEHLGVHDIAKKFKTAHIRVSKVLRDNNVPMTNKTRQRTEFGYKNVNAFKIPLKSPKDPNNILFAVCKLTGKKFKDINNLSGGLTSHMTETHPDVAPPKNAYNTKVYYMEHGKGWYEDYFDFVEESVMEKKGLDVGDFIKMKELYENGNGLETVCKAFKIGKKKLITILKDQNVTIKSKGKQSTELSSDTIFKFKSPQRTPKDPNNTMFAVCKSTGKKFKDINNTAGGLTAHLLKIFSDVTLPENPYQTKKYYLENSKDWYADYFEFTEENPLPTKKCSLCDWETTDLENKSGQFKVHLINEHDMGEDEYVEKFQDEIDYFNKYNLHLKKVEHLSDPSNSVICQICNNRFVSINSKHLATHGITMSEYKLKFPYAKIASDTYGKFFVKDNEIQLRPRSTKFRSKAELELEDFLIDLGVNVTPTCRSLLSGSEVDLYLPDHNLAIEFNGLYYHTEKMGKHRNYHIDKTRGLNSLGINLIHIFEDEWVHNKPLVLNKLKHVLNLNDSKKIFARNCSVVSVDANTKNTFLKVNHIQGGDKSAISLGLMHNDTMVAVMTFDNKRVMNGGAEDGLYGLSRYATDTDYIVVGGASKILSNFIKTYNPKKIVSFGDRRWVLDMNNNMYTKLGFKLSKILPPDYRYYNNAMVKNTRIHKFGFGKNNLKKKHPHLDFSKTERELTEELGYDRIWDCGLFRYELDCC